MGLKWNVFIAIFNVDLADLTLRQILEVFWYYCEEGQEKASQILKTM